MANPTDYNGGQLVVVSVLFLALTYLSVGLRFFVRIWILKNFQLDDWFILCAQGVFTLSCSFILNGVHYGLGRHDASLPQGERIQGLKYQTLATLTYVANMMFIKLSIAIFLLRIATEKRYIYTLKTSIVIVTIWSLAIFFFDIFQCTPVQAQWDFTIQNSKCAPGDSFVAAAYSISVLTVVTDWIYAIMPIFMIWSIQMTTQKKITIGFVLSLGVFASIATLIRLKYLIELSDYSDILFTGTTAMVWTLVEPGVAITAASLITIRPLLRALNFSGFGSTDNTPHPIHTFSTHTSSRNNNSRARRDNVVLTDWSTVSSIWNGNRDGNVEVGGDGVGGDGRLKGGKARTEVVRAEVVRTEVVSRDAESEEYIFQGREEGHIGRIEEGVIHPLAMHALGTLSVGTQM